MPDHRKLNKHKHRSHSHERHTHKSHSHSKGSTRRHSRSRSRSHSPHKHRENSSRRHTNSHRDEHSPRIKQEIKQERITPERSTHHYERDRNESVDLRPVKRERWSPPTEKRNAARGCVDSDAYRHERQRNDERRQERRNRQRNGGEVDESQFSYGKSADNNEEEAAVDKDKPDFALSGKLADESNTYRGIVINYNEPPEARKPKLKWRLYPFKGEEDLPVLHIHRQSGYLFGRDRKVADIPVDHPSCSKQHAVLQFRSVEYTKDGGMKGRRTRPYIIDLKSANGTYVNNKQIQPQRYVELLEKDTLKFGFSSRDYVILHDNTSSDEPSAEEL